MIGLHWIGDIDERFLWKMTQSEGQRLVICSTGGDGDIMTGALDLMRDRDWTTHTVGRCMSAAVPIVAIGAKGFRSASPSTRFLVHPPRLFVVGEFDKDQLDAQNDELKNLVDVYCASLGETTRKNKKFWLKQIEKDHYFNAEEAKKLGIIDEIV